MQLSHRLATLALGLAACAAEPQTPAADKPAEVSFSPNIYIGQSPASEGPAREGMTPDKETLHKETLQDWIDTSVTVLTSDAFATNLDRAALSYPDVWISRSRDLIPTRNLYDTLSGTDIYSRHLWWPPTQLILVEPDSRPDSRHASTGPTATPGVGEIRLGQLHFTRYQSLDPILRSCAINTMAHEISHTLSNRPDAFHMHILDTPDDGRPPFGTLEASYLIGTVAQCTWLEQVGHIQSNRFDACLLSFSDSKSGSRFNARVCEAGSGTMSVLPPAAH